MKKAPLSDQRKQMSFLKLKPLHQVHWKSFPCGLPDQMLNIDLIHYNYNKAMSQCWTQHNIIMNVQAVCIEEQMSRHRIRSKVCRSYIQYSTRKSAYTCSFRICLSWMAVCVCIHFYNSVWWSYYCIYSTSRLANIYKQKVVYT